MGQDASDILGFYRLCTIHRTEPVSNLDWTVLLCYCVTVLLCYCVTVLLCYCVTLYICGCMIIGRTQKNTVL